jgi:xylulose-5-phosphate/fructose-6-phosphate phosphoketolase
MAEPTLTAASSLSHQEAAALDAYGRAANYRSVGQIYLRANPLRREPVRIEDTKPRLLGHWGTTPGLNFVYAHMNRVIRARGLNAIVAGPGHGGPESSPGAYVRRGLSAHQP